MEQTKGFIEDGSYGTTGNYGPASYRYGNSSSGSYPNVGFRITLYLNN